MNSAGMLHIGTERNNVKSGRSKAVCCFRQTAFFMCTYFIAKYSVPVYNTNDEFCQNCFFYIYLSLFYERLCVRELCTFHKFIQRKF